jgi:hypothetical protein
VRRRPGSGAIAPRARSSIGRAPLLIVYATALHSEINRGHPLGMARKARCACVHSRVQTHLQCPMAKPKSPGIMICVSRVRVPPPASGEDRRARPFPDSWPRGIARDTHSLLGAIPARQPADDPAEPRLGREGEIGGHADDDAERQAQHRSERDRRSDAHTRESMRGVSARGGPWPPILGCWVLCVEAVGQCWFPRRGQRRSAEHRDRCPYARSAVSAGTPSPDR